MFFGDFLLLYKTATVHTSRTFTLEHSLLMTGLFHLHSGMRWVVVILAVITIIRMLMLYTKSADSFSKGDNTLVKLFTIFFDVQVTIGIIYFIVWAVKGLPIEVYHWEHLITMLLATVMVHLAAKFKTAPAKERAKKTMLFFILALVIVAIGVARLPQGWQLIPSNVNL
jgi:bacteriorhodopsin